MPENDSPSAVTQPLAAPASSVASKRRGWHLALTWIAVLLASGALLWVFNLSRQLNQAQQEMARRSADTMAAAAAASSTALQVEAVAKDLAARIGVLELRLSEVALQRTQLEELMLSVSRSRDDSLVQDIDSTLRLAFQQSQLTGSAQPLISALQGAEQRIERAAQPRLNPVQRAIARDIERLRAAELVDVPALVASIDELRRQVDELPLRNAPTAQPRPSAQEPVVVAQETPAETVAVLPEQGQEISRLESLWLRFDAWRSVATARWWEQFRHSTADLIRVSRIDAPEAALLAPEQSYLLRENIKLQLLNVRLGLLGRQIETVRPDIQEIVELVERYFDSSDPATRSALHKLGQIHADMGQEGLPSPDETFRALAVAATGR